jgi:hypothetical protein
MTYTGLRADIDDARYQWWVTALKTVLGIDLIADTSNGRLYVGKVDSCERICGR